jgi:hypothetical protein
LKPYPFITFDHIPTTRIDCNTSASYAFNDSFGFWIIPIWDEKLHRFWELKLGDFARAIVGIAKSNSCNSK